MHGTICKRLNRQLKQRRNNQEFSELALEGVRQKTRPARTNLDVLNAEQSLLDARVSLVQAERNQYVAAYNLLATTGRLTAKRLRIEAADISKEQ